MELVMGMFARDAASVALQPAYDLPLNFTSILAVKREPAPAPRLQIACRWEQDPETGALRCLWEEREVL